MTTWVERPRIDRSDLVNHPILEVNRYRAVATGFPPGPCENPFCRYRLNCSRWHSRLEPRAIPVRLLEELKSHDILDGVRLID